jgi:fermentation-respiration switch protein FrsA (DUF1100 family)
LNVVKLRRIRKKKILTLLIVCLIIFIMLRWFEHSQVYHPARTMDGTGAELGRPFEDVLFQASDGVTLNGWFYPANTNSARGSLAFLVCHGNAGNISHRLDLAQTLLATGAAVFLFDYRGFGRSQGRPSEEGTYLDAQAAYHWLLKKGFAGTNILLFGESLGGGVASELAVRESTGGLILQSTFTSIPDIGAEMFPWLPVRSLGHIKYDTCRKLPGIKIPVLVMHSRDDGLISFRHCQRNFAAANEPKLLCEIKGTHNSPMEDQDTFLAGIQRFLRLVETAKAPSVSARQ